MSKVKGSDRIAAPPVFVSECELTLDDEDLALALDILGLEEFLHKCWGFDKEHIIKGTESFYEVDNVEHRSRTKGIVKGLRYVGIERLDDEWIESGNPSEEAKDFARQDLSYLKEIRSLSKRYKSN